MASYEKAPEVDGDIEAIVVYTFDRWGADQARKYITGLEQKMEDLATGGTHSKPLDQVIEGLKVCRFERHYIFGQERKGKPMLILAIFHERMHIIERLKQRLG